MKSKILLGSVGSIGLATILGTSTALLASSPETITRLTTVSGIFGVASMGLFFVGLAFPKEEQERVKPMVRV